MAEVAYGNYQHQGYGNQGMMNTVQQYNQAIPMQNNMAYPTNPRYNPYQRPSPPMQICRNRQSPPIMMYKPNQMINRHSHQQMGWNNHVKPMMEDHNANSRMMPMQGHPNGGQMPMQGHPNGGQWQQNGWMGQNQVMKSVTPPLMPNYGPTTSPVIQGMSNLHEQVAMRRRMSSSSQSSEYGAPTGMPTPVNDNRWMVSPNSNPNNFHPAQFQQQNGGFGGPEVSPNPGAVPAWNSNQSLPYNTPSPMSSVSSDNSSPPPVVSFNQQPQFRHPAGVPQQLMKMPPPKAPLVSSDVPPGTTTGTSGNDWEVTCLGTKVKLRNSDLWKHFENVVMEMVISKHGRRMFPVLEYDIKGLHPYKLYSVFVDFVLANKYVWKFSEQKWNPSGLAPEEDMYDQSHRVCLHPESPAPGEVWNKRGVSFSKMKLSNHLHTDSDKLSLKSLHKYQPRLHVVEVDPRDPTIQTNLRTFMIPKTQFMTVTLYHNTDVAQLKINLNPFARCFRDKEISPVAKSTECTRTADDVIKEDTTSHIDDVTSPWNATSESISTTSPASNEPQQIYKVANPVQDSDLQRAKNFMQAQLNTMTQLVRTQDALANNSSPQARNDKPDATTLPSQQAHDADTVDFDRELEGLLGNLGDDNDDVFGVPSKANDTDGQKKKTVHHFPPTCDSVNIDKKKPTVRREGSGNPLDKYELLNVDRCFPPNAVAPLSNTLPFDPSTIKKEKSDEDNKHLPTFFKCSYYQEKAGQAVTSSRPQDSTSSQLPVIYVPKSSTNTRNMTSSIAQNVVSKNVHNMTSANVENTSPNTENFISASVVNDLNVLHTNVMTSPAPSASSSDSMASFNPFTLPTLSPTSLHQFLDVDINEMMSGNKRKCSFDDDIDDDDVFAGETSLMNACGLFPSQTRTIISTTEIS